MAIAININVINGWLSFTRKCTFTIYLKNCFIIFAYVAIFACKFFLKLIHIIDQ